MVMVLETVVVVVAVDPEGHGGARDTFPMLDAAVLVSVTGTTKLLVSEATEVASAKEPVKATGDG